MSILPAVGPNESISLQGAGPYVALLDPVRVSQSVAFTADRWTNERNPLRETHWGATQKGDGVDAGYGGGNEWDRHDWGHGGGGEWDRQDGDWHHHRWPGGGVPRPVPLPDALPLLISGLGSVLLLARRRRTG